MLCNKKTKLNIFILLMAVVVFSWPVVATAQEVNDVNFIDPNLEAELQMPGTIEGTGTYFEVTDSNYIDITFESTEPVHLRLESAPRMVTMDIERAEDADSTQITLGGFEPNTTYYKYQDDYHNEVAFTTDQNGSYAYLQDLTERHHVFIQPEPSTIFLSDLGWSNPAVGTWDSNTKTGTLTTNVTETIQIDSDGITLDGGGFSVIGSGTGNGVYLHTRTGVTVKNVNVVGFSYGIFLSWSGSNTLTGNNTASNNRDGIRLHQSSNNILIGNTASNSVAGICIDWFSLSNKLIDNIASYNSYGIYLYADCQNNTLTGNTASNNSVGICLAYNSSNNTLTGNTADSNKYHGILLRNCSGSVLTGNTASNNNDSGIALTSSGSNILTNNIANSNRHTGIRLWYSSSYNTLTNNTANSNNYLGIYLRDSTNNTLTGNTASNNSAAGIYLYPDCQNNTLTGNTASNNNVGIYLAYNSSNNTLTCNTASNNSLYGIYLTNNSSNNTLTGNTTKDNNVGIFLYSTSDNQIYNNNFIDNSAQAWVYGTSSGNVFYLDAPTGGNYWSDWTTPDVDPEDGFVDFPYVFSGGQDNLPWAWPYVSNQPPLAVCQDVTVMADSNCEGVVEPEDVDNGSSDPDGDPITLSLSPEGPYPIGTTAVTLTVTDDQGASSACTATVKVLTASEGTLQLVAKVMVLNLHNGIENSLDAKLENALKALDDLNANNDVSAINAIDAFINAVEAQSGDKIATEDADDLIDTANKIIVGLQNGCY